LLSRQPQPHYRGDDRERITRARQAAEALFTPRRQVAEPSVSDSLPSADQPVRKPRVLGISSPAPARLEEVEAPVAPEPQTPEIPRSKFVRIRSLVKYGHDRFPGRQGLRGCRRARSSAFSGRPDGAGGLSRRLRLASPLVKKSAAWGTWRFRVSNPSRAAWCTTTLRNGRETALLRVQNVGRVAEFRGRRCSTYSTR